MGEILPDGTVQGWTCGCGAPVGGQGHDCAWSRESARHIATRRALADLRERASHFIAQVDARVSGVGDFDAYHSARHDLVMALSERAPSDRNDSDHSRPLGPVTYADSSHPEGETT